MNPKKPTQTDSAEQRPGFALVVTLILMVLLAVIAIGLLSISSVALRTSGVESNRSIARFNAQLGLQMAINQLQKTMGPDQRVTATADLEFRGSDSSKWVGVYGNESIANYAQRPSQIPSEPYSPVLLNWLVSGNEEVSFTASESPGAFGSITSSGASPSFSPSDQVSGLDGTIGDITIAGQKAALLVGEGSVDNQTDESKLRGCACGEYK